MSQYRNKLNVRTGAFNLVPTANVLNWKAGVASQANLPLSGNTLYDARLTNDTHHLYLWTKDASVGLITDWVDQGDIIDVDWAVITNRPSSSVADIDDAVSKKHSNSLDHSQNTDQYLDFGGANQSTVADVKDAVQKRNDYQVVDGIKYARTSAGINAAIDSLGSNGGIVFLTAGEYLINEKIFYDYDNTIIRGASGLNTEYQLFSKYNTRLINTNRATFDDASETFTAGYTITGSINGYTAIVAAIVYDTATTGTIYYHSLSNVADFVDNEILTGTGGRSVTLSANASKPISVGIDFNARSNTELSNICIIGGIVDTVQHALVGSSVGGGTRLIDKVGFFYYNYNRTNGTTYMLMADNDTEIKNCYFYRCSVGISAAGGAPSWTEDRNKIYNNRFVECGYGVYFSAGWSKRNNIINANEFYNCKEKDITLGGTDDYNIIINNICINDGSGDIGIHLDNADGNIVCNNYTSGHSVCGIQIDSDCDSNSIAGNICKDSTPYIHNGTNSKFIIQNTISDGTNDATIANIKDSIDKKHAQNTDDKIIEGDSSVEVIDTGGESSIKHTIDNVEQLRLIDGKLYPITTNDISLGDADHKFKEIRLMGDSLYLGDTHITENNYNKLELNMMLNSFRIAVIGSLSFFNLVDGVMDEFEDETGVDTVNSENEKYDSSEHYYSLGEGETTTIDTMEYANDGTAQAAYVHELGLQSYSEDTIKYTGDYSLKITATQTTSLNQRLKHIISPAKDLTNRQALTLACRASRTGTNFSINLINVPDTCVLLVRGDGEIDTQTSLTDDSKNHGTVTFYDGTYPNIDDTTAPFGTTSIRCAQKRCTIPRHASMDFGTGDFCIEYFYKRGTEDTLPAPMFYGNGWLGEGVLFRITSTTVQIGRKVSSTGSWWSTNFSSGSTWHHLALVRNSGVVKLYIDGTLANTTDWTGEQVDPDDAPIRIGYEGSSVAHDWDGWLSEIRVWNYARYTIDFTPPTSTLGITKNNIIINEADTWEIKTIAITGSNFSNLTQMNIEILNADAENTIYLDNVYTFTYPESMLLISNSIAEAVSEPSTGRIVLFEEDIDSITLNTDLKAYFSRDDGATWATGTLVDNGDYASNQKILVSDIDLSEVGSGTDIKWKLELLNSKNAKIHGVGVLWS